VAQPDTAAQGDKMDSNATQVLGESKHAMEQWDKLVEGVRAVLRKAKGLPEDGVVTLPGDTLPVKYVRYALNNKGMLATGKQHGRRKPHWNKRKLALKSLSIELFRREFVAYESAMREAYAKEGKEFDGMHEGDIKLLAVRINLILPGEFNARRTAARVAARNRQRTARRVNFGLLPGSADRRAHAA